MHADQIRFRQALFNLLNNANKFTNHGTITVEAEQCKEGGRASITIAVTDTGIGMTADQMENYFRNLPRLNPRQQRNTAPPASDSPSAGAFVR